MSEAPASVETRRSLLALLFTTGLTSMGMEVVWVRQFTPYLGTVVYAFASILATYLAATFLGSCLYRFFSAPSHRLEPAFWAALAPAGLLPLVATSPDLDFPWIFRVVLGIAPFTGLVGFLTPMLVDRWAGGDPARAGKAYAVNVVGCILGPLLAGFLLLPALNERWSLALLALPWMVLSIRPILRPGLAADLVPRMASCVLLVLTLGLVLNTQNYDEQFPSGTIVMRDSTATVVATGSGMGKQLLVNGYGMTVLTPITKMMAHLPLAFLDRPPQNALAICFGMGTTFRSLRSWGIPVTALELVPSVPRLFGYFHNDGPELLRSPLSHVVIDDGRRYLERTSEQYDVVTIDPPPPLEAAGSSLLYSEDFYAVVRQRLRPGGIVQQWLPAGDQEDVAAIALALRRSFPFVRVFTPIGNQGLHFLASDQPIPKRTFDELAMRLPPSAAADLVEWGPEANPVAQFALLRRELPIDRIIMLSPATPPLSDDRPINEYYRLRQLKLTPSRR